MPFKRHLLAQMEHNWHQECSFFNSFSFILERLLNEKIVSTSTTMRDSIRTLDKSRGEFNLSTTLCSKCGDVLTLYKYTPIFYTSFIQKYILLEYLVDLINVWDIFGCYYQVAMVAASDLF